MGVAAQFPAYGWPRSELRTSFETRARRLSRVSAHLLATWVKGLGGKGLWQEEQRQRALARWAKDTLEIFNVRVCLKGRRSCVERPALIVANHVSWLDICVLASVSGARFVAKSEVRSWPLIGSAARRFSSLFHIRGHFRDAARIKDRVSAALRSGECVTVFPEGTTTGGLAVWTFYPAMLQAAIDASAVVQPVSIRYLSPDGAPNHAPVFVDDMTLAESIRRVLREREIVAELVMGEPLSPIGRTRRQLAGLARKFIAESLNVPLVDAPAGALALGTVSYGGAMERLQRAPV
ncbi:MAG: lysophospholipid acyltransferase family protein [Candidatus Binataceae bacterium]